MNNKAITRKAAVAGVVGLTAAGISAAIVLANDPAADRQDSKAVERQESVSALQYTGPRTADAAEAWLESGPGQVYTGPRTADAAEAWLGSGPGHVYTGPMTPDAAEHWSAARRDGQRQHPEPPNGSVADLYDGIDRREGPLGVHTR